MNNQYNQQPQYQQQYAPQPQMSMDPMMARQRKRDAFYAFSEKLAAFMQTHPVLKGISSISDILSYFITVISLVITIVVMCLGGAYQIFTVATILFGFFSMSKKSILPFAVSLSITSAFSIVTFILIIVNMAEVSKWGASVPASTVIFFIFHIVELAVIGCFTALAWTYFAAMLTPKMYQPMQQPVMQQPVQQPVMQPVMQQPAQVPVQKTCPACGSANAGDADFCKICGSKL